MVIDHRFERLYRQLAARECDQAVVRSENGRLMLVPAASPRLSAMLSAPEWAARVLGVFSPNTPFDELAEQVLS